MENNNMIKMDCEHGELPMEGTLCAFKFKDTEMTKGLIILGYLFFATPAMKFWVKEFGRPRSYLGHHFEMFQYILNER